MVSLGRLFHLELDTKYKSGYKDYTSEACLAKRKSKRSCEDNKLLVMSRLRNNFFHYRATIEVKISRYFETAPVFLSHGCPYRLGDKSFCVKMLVSRFRQSKRSFYKFHR